MDGVVGLQRAVWAGRPEAVANLHQPSTSQRRGLLRGDVGAEDHLQRALSKSVPHKLCRTLSSCSSGGVESGECLLKRSAIEGKCASYAHYTAG